MRRSFCLIITLTTLSFSLPAFSQSAQTDFGVAAPDQRHLEVKTELGAELPNLLEEIKQAGLALKQNKKDEAQQALSDADQILEEVKKVLNTERYYSEVSSYLEKIDAGLTQAGAALHNKNASLRDIAEAYRWTKALSQSPILKIAESDIALSKASQQIAKKNYRSAGLFLQQSVDALTEVEQDPRLNSQEIKKLKSDIIITQQQVSLGQMSDAKKLDNFYPGLAAARVNALNSYYDIWSRDDSPWNLY